MCSSLIFQKCGGQCSLLRLPVILATNYLSDCHLKHWVCRKTSSHHDLPCKISSLSTVHIKFTSPTLVGRTWGLDYLYWLCDWLNGLKIRARWRDCKFMFLQAPTSFHLFKYCVSYQPHMTRHKVHLKIWHLIWFADFRPWLSHFLLSLKLSFKLKLQYA